MPILLMFIRFKQAIWQMAFTWLEWYRKAKCRQQNWLLWINWTKINSNSMSVWLAFIAHRFIIYQENCFDLIYHSINSSTSWWSGILVTTMSVLIYYILKTHFENSHTYHQVILILQKKHSSIFVFGENCYH